MKSRKKHHESGNVLFLILIAVALFAALSYVVTSSSRSGGNMGAERYTLMASSISRWNVSIETAMQKLIITNRCSINQISFDADWTNPASIYRNTNSPASFRCHVFHPQGGGVALMSASGTLSVFPGMTEKLGPLTGEFVFNASNAAEGHGTTCTSAECGDLMFLLTLQDENKASKGFCTAYNDFQKVHNPGGNPPIDTNIGTSARYTGTFTASAILGDEAPELANVKTACFQETTGGGDDYRIFYVLYAQ